MANNRHAYKQLTTINPIEKPEIEEPIVEPEVRYDMVKVEFLMDQFLQTLNRGQLYWVRMDSGSCYANVKVPQHYELDFMLYPEQVKCRMEPCQEHLGYCRVFITNKHELPLGFQELLEPDNELTPTKFKEYAFMLFEPIQRENPYLRRIENKSICPAFTIEYSPRIVEDDPQIDRVLMHAERPFNDPVDIDWVPCLKVQKYPDSFMEWKTRMLTEEEKISRYIYVVPKKCATDGRELELWRMSYSSFEKKIIRDKCSKADRSVITTLKSELREVKEEGWKLCSFHIINHCLHFIEETPERPDNYDPKYYLRVINSLIHALESRNLQHFFIPNFNLLEDVDLKECQQFIEKLKGKKRKTLNEVCIAKILSSTM